MRFLGGEPGDTCWAHLTRDSGRPGPCPSFSPSGFLSISEIARSPHHSGFLFPLGSDCEDNPASGATFKPVQGSECLTGHAHSRGHSMPGTAPVLQEHAPFGGSGHARRASPGASRIGRRNSSWPHPRGTRRDLLLLLPRGSTRSARRRRTALRQPRLPGAAAEPGPGPFFEPRSALCLLQEKVPCVKISLCTVRSVARHFKMRKGL